MYVKLMLKSWTGHDFYSYCIVHVGAGLVSLMGSVPHNPENILLFHWETSKESRKVTHMDKHLTVR